MKWKISKERRELERNRLEDRQERINRAQKQKRDIMEKERRKNIQQRITDSLGELPRNRRILLERELDLERRLLLKEAKEEVWKKWRQNKGRKGTNPKIKTREDKNPMEEKLRKIEMEVIKFKEERDRKQQEESRNVDKEEDEETKKQKRLETKKRLEGYWEKLRWVMKILEETTELQSNIKKKKNTDSREEEKLRDWNQKTETEKIQTLIEEDTAENKEKQEEGTK